MIVTWRKKGLNVVLFDEMAVVMIVELTQRKRQMCEKYGDVNVSKRNRHKLNDMIQKHSYLDLNIQHRVPVMQVVKGSSNVRKWYSEKEITQAFIPINIVLAMIQGYSDTSGQTLPFRFQSCHENSERCALVIAIPPWIRVKNASQSSSQMARRGFREIVLLQGRKFKESASKTCYIHSQNGGNICHKTYSKYLRRSTKFETTRF